MSAAFQPAGTRILIVGESCGAWSLDSATWQDKVSYGGSIETGLAKFSPDGRAVATTHADGTLRLWNATTGELLWERAHENPKQEEVTLVDLAFSPDGTLLAVARDDRRVRFHEFRTGDSPRADLIVFPPRDLCWSPDGRRVLITGPIGRGAFRVEDLETGGSTLKHIFHSGDITSGAFSPDGALMLTSSKDGTIFVREVDDSNPVAHLKGDGGIAVGAAFSPGPGPLRVIGAFDDGTARVWPVDPLPGAIARKPRELQDWEQARETRLAKPLDYP